MQDMSKLDTLEEVCKTFFQGSEGIEGCEVQREEEARGKLESRKAELDSAMEFYYLFYFFFYFGQYNLQLL